MKKSTKEVKNCLLAISLVMFSGFALFSTWRISSAFKQLDETVSRNTAIFSNLSELAHINHVDETRLIEGEIRDMSAMIFAEREVEILHKDNITAGEYTILKDEEYVVMKIYGAQDLSYKLEIEVDQNNNVVNVKYPGDIFILTYHFDEHKIDKNSIQHAVELGQSIVSDIDNFRKDVTNYWSEFFSDRKAFDESDTSEDDPLMKMLDLVCLHEGIDMEAKWQQVITDDMKEKYGNYEVKFENTNPLEISADEQKLLDELLIVHSTSTTQSSGIE